MSSSRANSLARFMDASIYCRMCYRVYKATCVSHVQSFFLPDDLEAARRKGPRHAYRLKSLRHLQRVIGVLVARLDPEVQPECQTHFFAPARTIDVVITNGRKGLHLISRKRTQTAKNITDNGGPAHTPAALAPSSWVGDRRRKYINILTYPDQGSHSAASIKLHESTK
ncbi:uncharacterized protein CLUP02_15210 [Colletotrichum lupini]|uniref:Uncharacterized protein n=1 Tax=Colletotrichum lupini TaxID=145971 RepID=A0A9Q8WNB8_9PEZI|nr:uncharacterized protein CLUP02_15210 [Colletotrichum lupini]UQC89679.1 hypothetical protein CLUP02_15210 [Colletotrichum lupini]